MAIRCIQCGWETPATESFCAVCGYALPKEDTAYQHAPTPPPPPFLLALPQEEPAHERTALPQTALLLGRCAKSAEIGQFFGVRMKRHAGFLWTVQEVFVVKPEVAERGGYGTFTLNGKVAFRPHFCCPYCGARGVRKGSPDLLWCKKPLEEILEAMSDVVEFEDTIGGKLLQVLGCFIMLILAVVVIGGLAFLISLLPKDVQNVLAIISTGLIGLGVLACLIAVVVALITHLSESRSSKGSGWSGHRDL